MSDIETIADLERQADAINLQLFGGELQALPIVLHDDREEYGLFFHDRCISMHRHIVQHASAEVIASTLAHEMAHQARSKPGDAMHGAAWAAEMQRLGLNPDTSIIQGGAFDVWLKRWASER